MCLVKLARAVPRPAPCAGRSRSGSSGAWSECGAAARYSGPPTKKATLCGGTALRRSAQASPRLSISPAVLMSTRFVQVRSPPAARLEHIRRTIHIDAEFPHHIGAQIPFRLRAVQQKHTLLLWLERHPDSAAGRRRQERSYYLLFEIGGLRGGYKVFLRQGLQHLFVALAAADLLWAPPVNLALSPLIPDIFFSCL